MEFSTGLKKSFTTTIEISEWTIICTEDLNYNLGNQKKILLLIYLENSKYPDYVKILTDFNGILGSGKKYFNTRDVEYLPEEVNFRVTTINPTIRALITDGGIRSTFNIKLKTPYHNYIEAEYLFLNQSGEIIDRELIEKTVIGKTNEEYSYKIFDGLLKSILLDVPLFKIGPSDVSIKLMKSLVKLDLEEGIVNVLPYFLDSWNVYFVMKKDNAIHIKYYSTEKTVPSGIIRMIMLNSNCLFSIAGGSEFSTVNYKPSGLAVLQMIRISQHKLIFNTLPITQSKSVSLGLGFTLTNDQIDISKRGGLSVWCLTRAIDIDDMIIYRQCIPFEDKFFGVKLYILNNVAIYAVPYPKLISNNASGGLRGKTQGRVTLPTEGNSKYPFIAQAIKDGQPFEAILEKQGVYDSLADGQLNYFFPIKFSRFLQVRFKVYQFQDAMDAVFYLQRFNMLITYLNCPYVVYTQQNNNEICGNSILVTNLKIGRQKNNAFPERIAYKCTGRYQHKVGVRRASIFDKGQLKLTVLAAYCYVLFNFTRFPNRIEKTIESGTTQMGNRFILHISKIGKIIVASTITSATTYDVKGKFIVNCKLRIEETIYKVNLPIVCAIASTNGLINQDIMFFSFHHANNGNFDHLPDLDYENQSKFSSYWATIKKKSISNGEVYIDYINIVSNKEFFIKKMYDINCQRVETWKRITAGTRGTNQIKKELAHQVKNIYSLDQSKDDEKQFIGVENANITVRYVGYYRNQIPIERSVQLSRLGYRSSWAEKNRMISNSDSCDGPPLVGYCDDTKETVQICFFGDGPRITARNVDLGTTIVTDLDLYDQAVIKTDSYRKKQAALLIRQYNNEISILKSQSNEIQTIIQDSASVKQVRTAESSVDTSDLAVPERIRPSLSTQSSSLAIKQVSDLDQYYVNMIAKLNLYAKLPKDRELNNEMVAQFRVLLELLGDDTSSDVMLKELDSTQSVEEFTSYIVYILQYFNVNFGPKIVALESKITTLTQDISLGQRMNARLLTRHDKAFKTLKDTFLNEIEDYKKQIFKLGEKRELDKETIALLTQESDDIQLKMLEVEASLLDTRALNDEFANQINILTGNNQKLNEEILQSKQEVDLIANSYNILSQDLNDLQDFTGHQSDEIERLKGDLEEEKYSVDILSKQYNTLLTEVQLLKETLDEKVKRINHLETVKITIKKKSKDDLKKKSRVEDALVGLKKDKDINKLRFIKSKQQALNYETTISLLKETVVESDQEARQLKYEKEYVQDQLRNEEIKLKQLSEEINGFNLREIEMKDLIIDLDQENRTLKEQQNQQETNITSANNEIIELKKRIEELMNEGGKIQQELVKKNTIVSTYNTRFSNLKEQISINRSDKSQKSTREINLLDKKLEKQRKKVLFFKKKFEDAENENKLLNKKITKLENDHKAELAKLEEEKEKVTKENLKIKAFNDLLNDKLATRAEQYNEAVEDLEEAKKKLKKYKGDKGTRKIRKITKLNTKL